MNNLSSHFRRNVVKDSMKQTAKIKPSRQIAKKNTQ